MVRVYVVARSRPYREALEHALGASGRVAVVGTSAHPADAVGDLCVQAPQVALIAIPGPDGPAWAREIRAAAPGVAIIALDVPRGEREASAWADAGALAYVGSEACLAEVLIAIEEVATLRLRSVGYRSDRIGSRPPRAPTACADSGLHAYRRLTVREREIVRLIGRGLSNDQIAQCLFIALPTVKNHVHNILEKLGVRGRHEAVVTIRRAGVTAEERTPLRPVRITTSEEPADGTSVGGLYSAAW